MKLSAFLRHLLSVFLASILLNCSGGGSSSDITNNGNQANDSNCCRFEPGWLAGTYIHNLWRSGHHGLGISDNSRRRWVATA
jgi:hypothetical protein